MTMRLVDWADEEGARFGRSLLGSSAFAGTHTIEPDRVRTDEDGIRLEDALRRCGVEMDRFPATRSRSRRMRRPILNLHIEQGPVLESMGLPLGAVLGTKGVERHAITFHGQEAHSGSTPMNARRDALAAAAKLALEIRPIAGKHPDAVCTMGSVKTFPGIVTAVVGRCEATLDQRDLDAGVLAQMYREAREASERFAARRRLHGGVVAHLEHRAGAVSSRADRALRRSNSRDRRAQSHRLPSGPLHDAAEVARAGIPTVMMFVQSLQGNQPQQD